MLKEENQIKVVFETEGEQKTKKATQDINKAIEENTIDQKKNAQALDQNTSSQNRNNQAKSKGAKASGEYSGALKSISSKLTLQNLMMMARAITTVAQKTIELSKYSVDYIENLNLMDSAFGKTSESARKWVQSIANVYGFDESLMAKELGMFRQFGAALGFASDKADLLSENLVLMAGDISSLYNITFEQASGKLTSALTGQTKAIRSLGADITQATLQQELYNMGINESISNMNRAEKTLLIYLTLERQLVNSQGDLAKTLMSPSNQMKVFTEQVHRLARAIGNALLPVLAAILPIVNGVMAALTELFNLIATLLGFDPIQFDFGGAAADIDDLGVGVGNLNDALDGTSGSAGKAGKSVDDLKKKLTGLRGFDKLNVIQTPNDTSSGGSGGSGGGGGVGGLAGGGINSKLLDALKKYNAHLDLAGKKVQRIRNMILGWFGYTVNENGELVKLQGHATKIQKIFRLIGSIIKDIYDILADVVKRTIEWGKTDNAKRMFSDIGDIIIILLGWIKELTDSIKDLYFTYIAPVIPDILNALSSIVGIIKNILIILTPIFNIIVKMIKLNLAGVFTGIGVAIKLISTTLENMRLTFEYAIKIIKKLTEGDFKGATDLMLELWKQMLENAWKIAFDIFTYIKDNFIKKMQEAKDGVIKKLESIVDWFKELPYRLGYLIGQIVAKMIKFFTDPDYRKQIGEKIKEKIILGLMWSAYNAKKVLDDLKSKLKDKIKNMNWSDVGKAIGESILKAIFFPQYQLYQTAKRLMAGIKAGLNSQGSTTITVKGGGKTAAGTGSIGFRASGGFVDTGEMFIAREAGPELVGSIGNKTAVANNDQIVQAVSIGVQRAIEHSGIGNARVVIEASGDSSGLMNFITYKQKEQSRQYGL